MNNLWKKRLKLLSISVLAQCILLPVSWAQTADEDESKDETSLGTIIITATKRGEVSAQDTAAGITAFNEDKLDRLGVLDFDEFIVQVPGTNFIDNGGPGRGHHLASIRGLSPVADNTGPVVAEYLDGSPRFGRNYRLFDIGEVAVLRGPQGTLWGSQSVGGVIANRSIRPDFQGIEVKLQSDLYATRSADMSTRFSGAVNIPIVEDKFAVRVAGHIIDESGYIDNITTGKDDINDVSESAWRVSALYKPNDTLSFSLIYHGNNLETGAPSFFYPDAGDRVSTDPLDDLWGEQEFDLINFNIEADLEWATFSYTGSFYDMENNYEDIELGVFGFIPLGRTSSTNTEESTTHELRLVSKNNDRWDWIVGLYQDDFDSNQLSTQVEVANPIDPNWAAGVAVGFETFVLGGPQFFKENAIFGEVGYKLNDEWRTMIGARYFDWTVGNSQELTYFGTNYNQTSGEVGDSDSFYKVQFEYRPTDNALLYFTRSEGFRFGGYNPFVGLEGIGPDVLKYDPDRLINYELGLKSVWADGKIIFNAAIYSADWEDVQVVVLAAPPSPWAYTANGGLLESKGLELEITTQDLLFEGSYFAFNYTNSDAEFQNDVDPNNAGRALIEKGDKLQRSPDSSWGFDMGYDFNIGNNDAYVRLNHWHKGETNTEGFNGNFGTVAIPPQDVVNGSFGINFDTWSAKLYVKNLTDSKPILSVATSPLGANIAGRMSTIRPRTIGMEFTYRYNE